MRSDANNPSLLPNGLLQAAGGVPKDRTAVKLGPSGVQAYRYANVKLPGLDKPATLYTVPTAQGVVTIACVPSARNCDDVANSLQLLGDRAYPVGPSDDYAKAVSAALSGLDTSGLAKAKTRAAQAAALKRLQNAYGKAAASLRGQQLSPADRGLNARLVAALGAMAKAYGNAAAAAAHGDKPAYEKTRGTLAKDQGELRAAIANLRAAGYELHK